MNAAIALHAEKSDFAEDDESDSDLEPPPDNTLVKVSDESVELLSGLPSLEEVETMTDAQRQRWRRRALYWLKQAGKVVGSVEEVAAGDSTDGEDSDGDSSMCAKQQQGEKLTVESLTALLQAAGEFTWARFPESTAVNSAVATLEELHGLVTTVTRSLYHGQTLKEVKGLLERARAAPVDIGDALDELAELVRSAEAAEAEACRTVRVPLLKEASSMEGLPERAAARKKVEKQQGLCELRKLEQLEELFEQVPLQVGGRPLDRICRVFQC